MEETGIWIAGFVSGVGASLIVAVVVGWVVEALDGNR